MEENKNCCNEMKNCCSEKSCCCARVCCFVKKHKLVRIVIVILALLIAFCLGAQYGKIKSFYRHHDCNFYKNNMMMQKNWKDDDYNKINNLPPKVEVEVEDKVE